MDDEALLEMNTGTDNILEDTGVVEDKPVLSLDLSDKELIANFSRWVADSVSYWNSEYRLKEARERNERFYLGKQVDLNNVYDHQSVYIDNQIYVGTQSIIAYVSGNTPSCEIVPEDDTTQSMVMAQDLEHAVNIHTERHQLAKKIKAVAKSVYIKRVGVIKLKWDDLVKDIIPVVVDPGRLILDKDCRQDEEPKFIVEICTDSVATIMKKFPGKEKEIMRALGRERKTSKLMGTIISYNEVWFTDETAENDEDRECVAWYFGDVILDKMRNPNYLYSKEGVNIKNFLDIPTKPYVFFNFLNDGSSLIDQTTPIEQAVPLQIILNKRGSQITDNADTANSTLLIRSGAIKDRDLRSTIPRKPNQILQMDLPDEQPVANSFGEIPPHLLPNYVLEDKQDIKNGIHNILGSPSQFRGDDSKRDVGTLGEAKMIQNQAGGRQDEFVREIEYSVDRYFRLLVQMMKVYYDQEHSFASRDADGKFMSVQLSRSTMPNVAHISVMHGSLLRVDRERQENISMALARMGLIDPYSLFKDLSLKDSVKRYDSLMKFKMDPTLLLSDIDTEVADRDAYIDFSVIMNGHDAKPRRNVKIEYIKAAKELMMTDEFLYASKDRQKKWADFITDVIIGLRQRAKLDQDTESGATLDTPEPGSPDVPVDAEQYGAPAQPVPAQPPIPPEELAELMQEAAPSAPSPDSAPNPTIQPAQEVGEMPGASALESIFG